MILAILQLRDAQRDRLGAFARELLDVLQFLPQFLRVRHFREDVLEKTTFRCGKTSNPTRHDVRLKTGSRVQRAAGRPIFTSTDTNRRTNLINFAATRLGKGRETVRR